MEDYDSLIEEIMEAERYRQVVWNEARKMPDSWGWVGDTEWPFFEDLENARNFDKAVTVSNEYRENVFEKAKKLQEEYDIPLSQYIRHKNYYYKLEATNNPQYVAFSATKKAEK